MIPNLNIAAIQFDIVWEDKAANFKKIENDFFSNLKQGEIDLIVLPEMFATGFTMKPQKFFENEDGVTFTWLKSWAQKLNTHICGGLITQNKQGEFLNTLVFVGPDGKVDYYYKRHLFRMGEENKHYIQGNNAKIVQLKGWKVKLQICYDLRFPVFARNKMVNDSPAYDLLIYIANWPEVRINAWSNLLLARAIENQSFVLGVNRVGDDGNGIAHNGASTIIDPVGNYLVAPLAATQIMRQSLNYSLLSKSRSVFPVLLDGDSFNLTIQ